MLVRDPKKRLTAHEVLCESINSLLVFINSSFIYLFIFFFLNKVRSHVYIYLLPGHPWIQVGSTAPDKPLDSAVLSRLKQFSAMNKLKKMALRVNLNYPF